MRRLSWTLLYALGAVAPCSRALAAAPPPDAVDPDAGRAAGLDRYGGGARLSALDPVPVAEGGLLSWSGKTLSAASERTNAAAETGPSPPPPPARRAAARAGGPRFYSVHRDYGLEPDPIPLAPQVFGPTADLSAPALAPAAPRPGRPVIDAADAGGPP
jgi:hypothetical protein